MWVFVWVRNEGGGFEVDPHDQFIDLFMLRCMFFSQSCFVSVYFSVLLIFVCMSDVGFCINEFVPNMARITRWDDLCHKEFHFRIIVIFVRNSQVIFFSIIVIILFVWYGILFSNRSGHSVSHIYWQCFSCICLVSMFFCVCVCVCVCGVF